MVSLLNAKLRKALNGEIEENVNDQDNEDNIYCSNCNLLRKEKKLLENKVQNLLDTIHEKDMEISKLKEMLGISGKSDVNTAKKNKKKKKKKIKIKIRMRMRKMFHIHHQIHQMIQKKNHHQKKEIKIKIITHYLKEMMESTKK